MKVVDVISLIFIFCGITIIIAIYLYNLRLKKYFNIVNELLLNLYTDKYNVETVLDKIEYNLKKIKILKVFYNIDYLDTQLNKEKDGNKCVLKREIKDKRGFISISFCFQKIPKNEDKFIYGIILDLLVLIVRLNIFLKYLMVQETFEKVKRINAFILHDVKNLAQFIAFLKSNIENLKADQEKEFFYILKDSIELINIRAKRVISFLQKKEIDRGKSHNSYVDLRDKVCLIFSQYKMDTTIKGNIFIEGSYLEDILIAVDNIVKNIYEKSLQSPLSCFVIMYKTKNVRVLKIIDTGATFSDIDRIFEPFFTTKRSGLGLGLFHSKELIQRIGGDIRAKNIKIGVMFRITLPMSSTYVK